MNTILEDLTEISSVRRGLYNIRLVIGDSLFEIKYVGCFGATGNAQRVTIWESQDHFVHLTERFMCGTLCQVSEETNMKTEIELQNFKDEWNHRGMDPRHGLLDIWTELLGFF